jgi:hypothetical protein
MKDSKVKKGKTGSVCTYKDFLLLIPFCTKGKQEELLGKLRSQPKPFALCGKELPKDLNSVSYGTLDDLRTAASSDDPISECVQILLGVELPELMLADVNDVFGFLSFVTKELEKINKLFSGIKQTFCKEEEAAGIKELDFGSFGVLDWYARRMGITNQNDVRDVAWVRIYQCMKNDNMQSEYERRLQKQYLNNSKSRRKQK